MTKNRRTMKRKAAVLATVLTVAMLATIIAGCGGGSTNQSQTTGLDKEMQSWYLSVDDLKSSADKVQIIDARPEKEYAAGHIPGSVNITWQMLSNMTPQQGEPGWGVVLPQDQLEKKIGSFGIDGSKDVVIYNDPAGSGEDGRVLWMLRMAGINNTRMLNGGWPAWTKAGGASTNDVPVITPVDFKIKSFDSSTLCDINYIKNNKDKIKLVDTRSPEEYKGEINHKEKALGRIPGAVLICWRDAYKPDGTIKSVAELKEIFAKAGLNPDDDIVCYCTVGIRSAFVTDLLRMCGYSKAKNYNASFSEWAGDPANPIEK